MKFEKYLKPLINLELLELVEVLEIKNFRGIFMRDNLPDKPRGKEVGILNLDSSKGMGTHWVCYFKNENKCYYFDSFGLDPPEEFKKYLKSEDKKSEIKQHKFVE